MGPKATRNVLVVGRILLGAVFLFSAVGKLTAWGSTAAYAGQAGVTTIPLAGATALELIGGISLVVGYKVRWGALALLVFLVPVTLVMHAFWAAPKEMQQLQLAMFLKNVAIAGGLLVALASAAPASAPAPVEQRQPV
jgi:putative oxidoreductase